MKDYSKIQLSKINAALHQIKTDGFVVFPGLITAENSEMLSKKGFNIHRLFIPGGFGLTKIFGSNG